MDNVNELPVEILMQVFDFLTIRERKNAALVCSHWYNVLQCPQFQRQRRLILEMTFEAEFNAIKKKALKYCRNLYISSFTDYDDPHEEELKYSLAPTPENNLRDLLFGYELPIESLCFQTNCDRCQNIIEYCLPQLKNLRELELILNKYLALYEAPDSSIWIIQLDRLQSFCIRNACEKPYQLIAPYLTTLDLEVHCRWDLELIETYSRQLQFLKMEFSDIELVDPILAMSFPKLSQLDVRINDDRDIPARYTAMNNSLKDMQINEEFVRGMPQLRKLDLTGNLMFFRMSVAMTKHAHLLQELTLDNQIIDYERLKTVELLPGLKSLTIKDTIVIMPMPRNLWPMFPMLELQQIHRLIITKSNIAINDGLENLKYLEISITSFRRLKILHKICKNLPHLEHLGVTASSKLQNTALRYLHLLTKLSTLKFDSIELNDRLWVHCPTVPSVRRLIFDGCTFDLATLQSVAKLFPSIRELYLDRCCFNHCDHEEGVDEDEEYGEEVDKVDKDEGNKKIKQEEGGEKAEITSDSGNDESSGDKDEAAIQNLIKNRVRRWFPQSRVSFKEPNFCCKFH